MGIDEIEGNEHQKVTQPHPEPRVGGRGPNCLVELANDLVDAVRDLQFDEVGPGDGGGGGVGRMGGEVGQEGAEVDEICVDLVPGVEHVDEPVDE